jgi:hypothetical protein
VAGQRYAAPPGAAMAALGPDYSVWRDLPSTGVEGEVAYHRGRAALPLHALGLSAFTKAFFQRREPGEDGEELFGRVVHPNPLANWLLPGPMYFRCRVGAAVAPSERRRRRVAPRARLPSPECSAVHLTPAYGMLLTPTIASRPPAQCWARRAT